MQDLSTSGRASTLLPSSSNMANFSSSRSSDFDIQSVLGILGRRWWIILGVGLAVSIYQTTLDLKRPPIYQESFRLLVQPPEQDITNPLEGAAQVLNNNSSGDYFSTQMTILVSNKLLDPVVKKIHEKYPDLDKKSFDYQYLASKMQVTQVNGGQILSISYQDSDPKRVKFVLDQLAKSYLQYTLEEQRVKSQQKLGFITQQLPVLQQRVNFLQQQLLKLQQDNNFFDPLAQGGMINSSLNTILEKKQDIEIQIQQNRILATKFRQQLGKDESQALALHTLSQSAEYNALLGRLNEINMKLAEESTRLTDDNVVIQQLKQERDNILPLINQQSNGVLEGLPNGVPKAAPKILAPNDIRSDSVKKLLDINAQLATLEKQKKLLSFYEVKTRQKLKDFSSVVTQYLNIQRQLTLATDSLNRLLEAEQTLEIETSKRFIPWRIVDDPRLPTEPVDRFLNNLILAIVKGLVVGGLVGGLVELLDRKYHSVNDLSKDTNATVLGVIPWISELKYLNSKQDKFALTTNNATVLGVIPWISELKYLNSKQDKFALTTNTGFLESFSVLFSSVFFIRQKQNCRSFVVTSATSGDGKSTVSFFTAFAAAQLGQRVLLVDGDRYFPQGERWLQLAQSVPSNSKKSEMENQTVIVEELLASEQPIRLIDNLDYFKTQDNAMDPDQLMSSQSLLVLLKQWQQSYDVILIDTPPILGLSDSRLIASQTDGVLLVVRLEKTLKDHLYSALEALSLADLTLLGIVANGVKKNFGSYDYNYNNYNHYYRKKVEENFVKIEENSQR